MKQHFSPVGALWRLALCVAVPLLVCTSAARAQPTLCENGKCAPVISAMTYFNRPAYKLSDGKTEAIIVPQIGRIMSFGKVGGPNLLWNSATHDGLMQKGWKNYGGDKTWLAPQSSWKSFHGKDGWPPDPAFDGQPQRAEVLTGGKLKLITPLAASGMRLTRTMYFDDNGEFVIEQTALKEKGAPVRASIWSITQIMPGEVIFLPVDPNSTYPSGFHTFDKPNDAPEIFPVATSVLLLRPFNGKGGVKIGVDAPVSSLVSVRGQVAFLQKTTKPSGVYPDGKDGAGFPVEVFVNGDEGRTRNFYVELELLGPLKTFSVGGKSTHTVRWSLHDLPSQYNGDPAVIQAIEKLLYRK